MTTEATTITTTTTIAAAAARCRTVRLFVDDSTERVVLAEAGEGAAAFILSVLADPRAAVEALLREDPAFAAAGCYASLSAFESLSLLPRSVASSSVPPVLPRACRRPAASKGGGRGIMAWRLFRCDHLWCRCSDVASRTPGSACPCASCGGRRDTELHFLEASFYRRPDGSAVTAGRGAGRSGDTFYRCKARDAERGRDFLPCRYRVTDERGVRCQLCHGLTSVEVKCAKAGGGGGGGEPAGSACRYAILDDLTVIRPVVVSAGGLSVAALFSAAGVTVDPATVREVDVPFGYKEVRAVSRSLPICRPSLDDDESKLIIVLLLLCWLSITCHRPSA
jgi:hypothetical protein